MEDQGKRELKSEDKGDGTVPIVDFAALQARLEAAEKAVITQKQDAERRIAELESAADRQAVELFCKEHIARGIAPALFDGGFKMFLASLNSVPVLEFEAGKPKVSARVAFQNILSRLLELSVKGALHVPIGEFAAQAHGDPATSKKTLAEKQQEKVLEFWDEAKNRAQNPQSQSEILTIACDLAVRKYGKDWDKL